MNIVSHLLTKSIEDLLPFVNYCVESDDATTSNDGKGMLEAFDMMKQARKFFIEPGSISGGNFEYDQFIDCIKLPYDSIIIEYTEIENPKRKTDRVFFARTVDNKIEVISLANSEIEKGKWLVNPIAGVIDTSSGKLVITTKSVYPSLNARYVDDNRKTRDIKVGRVPHGFLKKIEEIIDDQVALDAERAKLDGEYVKAKQSLEDLYKDYSETSIELGTHQVIDVLLLLNCINFKESVEVVVPPEKLNRKREKNRKLPFYEYYILKIAGGSRSDSLGGGTHMSPRMHLRRGHPRRLQTGKITWVRPCVVGNIKNGIIDKDYTI